MPFITMEKKQKAHVSKKEAINFVSLSTFPILYFYYFIYDKNMNGHNRPQVIDELIEVQDFTKITDRFKENVWNRLHLSKGNPKEVNM